MGINNDFLWLRVRILLQKDGNETAGYVTVFESLSFPRLFLLSQIRSQKVEILSRNPLLLKYAKDTCFTRALTV